MSKRIILTFSMIILLIITGCISHKERKDDEIKIGVMVGPESALLETAKQVAKEKYGLKIEIVNFENYVLPNTALADGSIDANMFQHLPYLQAAVRTHHYPIESIGRAFIYPVGLYSKKIKSLNDIPLNAKVAIPNDPSNGARALLLLQAAHLITLDDAELTELSLSHITSNPHQLVFIELDAAQLPRSLDDVDFAIINTNYAVPFHLYPSKDALFKESSDSPYANIVAIRSSEKDKPKYQKLMQAIQSPEVVEKAKELFQGEAIKGW